MSIISCVYVPEGIAMAADSRLTAHKSNSIGGKDRFAISDNAVKLFLLKKVRIGIGSCGDVSIDNILLSNILESFEEEKVDFEDDVKSITEKLLNYFNEIYPKADVTFFVIGYRLNKPCVYRILNKEICIDFDINSKFGACWDGEKTILHGLMSNQMTNIDYGKLPILDAVELAEFMVEVVIKCQQFNAQLATCGGPIDVLIITKDYAKFIKHKIINPR